MARAITRQQQQNFNSKRQKRSHCSTDAESSEASQANSWAAYIQELRHEWEDTP
jgi:hypothetical protein